MYVARRGLYVADESVVSEAPNAAEADEAELEDVPSNAAVTFQGHSGDEPPDHNPACSGPSALHEAACQDQCTVWRSTRLARSSPQAERHSDARRETS
jgi:hypothetical protein